MNGGAQKAVRNSRWQPETGSRNALAALSEDFSYNGAASGGAYGSPRRATGAPAAGKSTLNQGPLNISPRGYANTASAASLRPMQQPFVTPLLDAGRKLIGNNNAATLPLSNSDMNPLFGESEGANVKAKYRMEYKKYANSQLEGSMENVRERSWSKSKRGVLQ